MMEKIIDKIIDQMKSSESLTDDEEIVRYGLEIMITKMIFAVSIAVVGFLMRGFFEGVVFTAAYSYIRKYGGGGHAKTRIGCYIRSMLTFVVSLGVIKLVGYMPVLAIPLSGFTIISAVYIFIAAPVDSENKRLDNDEVRVFGKKAKVMTILMLLISAVLLFFKLNIFAFSVMTGIVTAAFLMIAGQIDNYRSGENL